jgi:general secretion pathway protein J
MRRACGLRSRGFTLIELLTALLVLSLLALMCYRGLGEVLDARDHVRNETDKWQHVAAFLARFGRDVELASPRPVRRGDATAPAWLGAASPNARLEFSRFASVDGVDAPRRIGYALNDRQQIELQLWPGLDAAPDVMPARYDVLSGVQTFELQYLDSALAWTDAWPRSEADPPLPRAVRLRLVLASGEEIVRIFALQS